MLRVRTDKTLSRQGSVVAGALFGIAEHCIGCVDGLGSLGRLAAWIGIRMIPAHEGPIGSTNHDVLRRRANSQNGVIIA